LMTAGAPDFVQIVMFPACPNTLLRTCRGGVASLLAPKENVLELVHPGIDEQQGRVTGRHKRRALDDGMAAIFEKFEESPADFVTGH